MSEIKQLALSSLHPNPMRKLAKYPFSEDKIAALRRSISDVGLWEGVIARKKLGEYQIAFGHHRVEASRKELGRDARIPVILRDLTDEQMIQFMGRENMEDYNAEFLVMLESWEAALEFLTDKEVRDPQAIDVAQLLGWTRPSSNPASRAGASMINATAEATSAASKLIAGGYLERETLKGLPVSSVRAITTRVVAQHEMLERMAKVTKTPAADVERSKRVSGKAGAKVAKDVRAGKVAQRDIKGEVDVAAYRHAKEAKKQSPLFAMFGKSLADQIARICKADTFAEKFNDIKRSLSHLTFKEDVEVVERIAFECDKAAERFDGWAKVFDKPNLKVVPLKEISGGRRP